MEKRGGTGKERKRKRVKSGRREGEWEREIRLGGYKERKSKREMNNMDLREERKNE